MASEKTFEFRVYTTPARSRSKRRRASGVSAASPTAYDAPPTSTAGDTGSGSDGHSHANKTLLDSLSTETSSGHTYLERDGGKLSAGYADEAGEAGHATSADTASEAAHSASATDVDASSPAYSRWLRKDVADTAKAVITFAKGFVSTLKSYFNGGIEVSGGTSTDTLNASGAVGVDGVLTAGKSQALAAIIDWLKSKNIVTENLTVTGAAHFLSLIIDELKSQQGAVILTSANCKADLVKPLREINSGLRGYIVYFRASDADGHKVINSWLVGDQAICQTFNSASGTSYNASNRYYWRLVEDVSAAPVPLDDGNDYHYIVLSETVYASGGIDEPAAGDYIVQLGYRGSDSTVLPGRQSAIILSAYPTPDTELVPAIFAKYAGINDFALASHRETFLDASRNRFIGEFRVLSGGRTISISNAVAEEMMGGSVNNLKASDFATAADVAECWTKVASSGSSTSYISISEDRLSGQSVLSFDLSARGAAGEQLLQLQQTVTALSGTTAGTVLCLSMYVRRTTYAAGQTVIGFESFNTDFSEAAWTGDNVSSATHSSGRGGRYYWQFYVGDTEWHRLWVTFTPASFASFKVGLYAWCAASVAAGSLPEWQIAMPKLEPGSEPTLWTPMADVLRRAGIDIVGSAVKIYGENISLEGTVTANGGFGIGLDGSMYARNGTFAGFVRTEMRCIDSSLLPSLMSTDADFIAPESMEGSSDYLSPAATAAGSWLDLLKSGSCFLFTAAAPVHLPFVASHGYYSQRTFEAAFREAYDDDTKYWREVLRARSFVGSTIEIVNQSGGFVYLCGIGGSDLSTGTFPTNAWVRYALGDRCMIRLECRRTTTGSSNQAYIDTVDWHVVSYAARVSIPIDALS